MRFSQLDITMDMVITLLVLSTLPQLAVPKTGPSVTSLTPVVEILSGDSWIFSGESVRLRCSIPDLNRSSWNFLWFRGSEQLPQNMENLTLWRATVKESGKYYCQGVRDSAVGNIYTDRSLPMEINIDGGWAILQVPKHPGLVGDTLKVTCRVRRNPRLNGVILYKDGVEVMRQSGLSPHLYLNNLKLEDQGLYSCRASWDVERRTRSVVSAHTQVQVLEVLTEPGLEIVADDIRLPANMMKLICHLQYNAPAPAPPIHYYFYMNNYRLGIATSENHDLVKRTPGQYSCEASVPELGISRWSKPVHFGKGSETPTLHPRDPGPLAPPITTLDLSLFPAAEPTAASQQPTAKPTFIGSTVALTQPSGPPLKPLQPAPSAPLPTARSVTQTLTPGLIDISEESGDMSGSGEFDDMSGDSPDFFLQ